MNNTLDRFLRLNLVIILLIPLNLFAQFGGESHVDARLISEVKTVQPGASFWVAARLQMNDGWHTYWRNPGDSGLETTIEWNLPEGFSAGDINWPYPERISEPPLVIYGYHDTIYLLTKITVDKSASVDKVIFLKAKVSWLECEAVCIPGSADIKVRLEIKNESMQTNDRYIETFANARAQLPITSEGWKIQTAIGSKSILIQAEAQSWFNGTLEDVQFFPNATNFINNVTEKTITQE